MAISLGSLTSGFTKVGSGWMLMVGAIVLVFVILFFILTVKRNKKFAFPCYQHVSCSNGKDDMYPTKAGWFRKRTMMGRRIELGGEYEMITQQGTKIYNVASSDYHFVNGNKCLHVQRDEDDPEILVPIADIRIDEKSHKMLNSIAPADYRDVSVQILERKQKETDSWWDKNKAMIVNIIMMVVFIIALIVVTQWIKGETTDTREMLVEITRLTTQKAASSGAA
jgi:hypothetical protein